MLDEPEPAAAGLVAVGRAGARLSKVQRAFNRLIERVRALRGQLQTWDEYSVRYHRRLANEVAPAEQAARAAQRRLLMCLDRLMELKARGERLSRKHRALVRDQILQILDELLAAGPDAELEALQEKYRGMSRAQLQREEMELAESMLGELFGADAVSGHDAQDLDELLQMAGERIAGRVEAEERERERLREQRRARRRETKGPTKAEIAAERKEQARRAALQSVREIYRKLASALHPDRESDAGERERKTTLMQRVNQAYERSDLLELLTLQIEIEQIDPDHLAETPETRIQHFNEVLQEQQRTLQSELEERLMPFRLALDQPGGRLTPRMVDRNLDAHIGQAQALSRAIEADLERLDDPRERRALLDGMAAAQEPDHDAIDLDELILAQILGGDRSRPQRRKRRQRRTRKGP